MKQTNIKPFQITLAITTAIMIVASMTTQTALSQTFRINHQGKTGHAFTTKLGTISALHVGGLKYDYYCSELDIAIETNSKSENGFTISDLPPAYFIDRRGTRHTLNAIDMTNNQTIVSLRFFFGESGMPIFAADGTVCCVVLGNAFIRGRWRGRVARITPLTSFIKKANSRTIDDDS